MKLAPRPERNRLVPLVLSLSLLFSLLIWRFYQIQIKEGARWTSVALAQHQLLLDIPFKRGSFYSNTKGKEEQALTRQWPVSRD